MLCCAALKRSSNSSRLGLSKTDGIAKITINRPEVRNSFRPLTVQEMMDALQDARMDAKIGVIILTGEGKEAFCAGGDQRVRGDSGYKDEQGTHHLNVLEFQRQIRTCPKPIIAMVAGYAIGGGHILHLMCDLTIAAENAVFGQTGPGCSGPFPTPKPLGTDPRQKSIAWWTPNVRGDCTARGRRVAVRLVGW